MLKTFVITTSLAFSLILLTNKATFSSPQPQRTPSSNLIKHDVNEPVCYLRTSDGRTLDLSSLCGTRPENIAIRKYPSPYNTTAIKKFDDDLYGKGN
ncbi:hypothetical protein NDI37_00075 [Funiculus sociatus GB2-A5]|jgi:hypothetical protein|uniref:Uncharacterized protein n=1 Tax=Funiculus sociatus GB2-A5 TaxID=2933946 RepID=A0ABV0JHJ5_9CYAN|nr:MULTISPECIES: hypothetical protein [unclassified Trichocoleus]MBD1908812.1 hypothetical protein [Trichocoleus sp. FACHB-832]MBD2064303.1 hypothetical protein [Trichocoleus sp. FACHB-6]